MGKLLDSTLREVEELLRSYKVTDAVVKITGEVTLDDVEDAIFESTIYKPAVVVANKIDVPGAFSRLRALERHVQGKLPVVAVSCEQRRGLEQIGEKLFKALGVIRIYTKEPAAREPSPKPFTLKRGATVSDLARSIHGEFVENFVFAKVWAKRLVFSPQKVGLGFVLEDEDVVEIHVR